MSEEICKTSANGFLGTEKNLWLTFRELLSISSLFCSRPVSDIKIRFIEIDVKREEEYLYDCCSSAKLASLEYLSSSIVSLLSPTPPSQNVFRCKKNVPGLEPWSSGYGWQLMFKRSWVQIRARIRILDGHFSHWFVVQIVWFVWKKTKNKRKKEAAVGPFKKSRMFHRSKKIYLASKRTGPLSVAEFWAVSECPFKPFYR